MNLDKLYEQSPQIKFIRSYGTTTLLENMKYTPTSRRNRFIYAPL